jgi:hypothetical protein
MDTDTKFYRNFIKTLERIYSGEVQRKRIKKEIDNLSQIFENLSVDISYTATPLGLKLNIVLANELLYCDQENHVFTDHLMEHGINVVVFDILLEQKFPLIAPKVFCLSELAIGCEFNDGRDIFKEIMEKPWSAFVLIADFIWKLQDFVKRVITRKDD